MNKPSDVGSPNEYLTGVLAPEAMRAAIESLPRILRDLLGQTVIEAFYQFGCNLHFDLCYVPMRVGTAWLDRFVSDSLAMGIVVPCESDFEFSVAGGALVVRFCHEGDIHV